MLIFKALHILSMFAAVTFLVGEAVLYGRAVWRRDVAGLASVRRLVGGRPQLGASFLVAGIAFGIVTALTGGFDVFAGWLVAAYVLIVALFLVNGSTWVQRLPRLGAEAIEAEAGTAPGRRGRRCHDRDARRLPRCSDRQRRALRGDHCGHGPEAVLGPIAIVRTPLRRDGCDQASPCRPMLSPRCASRPPRAFADPVGIWALRSRFQWEPLDGNRNQLEFEIHADILARLQGGQFGHVRFLREPGGRHRSRTQGAVV